VVAYEPGGAPSRGAMRKYLEGKTEKKMLKKKLALSIAVSMLVLVVGVPEGTRPVHAVATVPPGFTLTQLASGMFDPKGITSSPANPVAAGCFGNFVYVAESGLNEIDQVSKTGGFFPFAGSGSFPVGVNFFGGFTGPFGGFLYIGNAFGAGITRSDCSGVVTPFTLGGLGIAGIDLGTGVYAPFAYAGEWQVGNIWKISPTGSATLFGSFPGTQTRYLKFSQGDLFGTFLYYSDANTGRIVRVGPTGAASTFAVTGSPCLEGFEISPLGSGFGDFMYAGDVCSGTIYQISPTGAVTTWATGFAGVADIHFQIEATTITMYVSDAGAGTIYAISSPLTPPSLAQTDTSVSCSPSTIAVYDITQCTAFVTDDSVTPTSPTGMVTFSSSGSGQFGPRTCTLSSLSSSTASCHVLYRPAPGSEGVHTVAGSYGGDATHRPSQGYITISVTKRSTSTDVSCSPSTTQSSHPTTCTVVVTDTSHGTPLVPTGTVSWTSSGTGTFSATTCTLTGTSTSTASCTVTYTPDPGKPRLETVTGSYGGDRDHSSSSGGTAVNVL